MRKRGLRLLPLAAMLLLAACATWQPVEESSSQVPNSGYAVSLPKGWMRLNLLNDRLMVTADGIAVQSIEVASLEPATAFEQTLKKSKKKIGEDMLPEQLAELALAEVQATETMGNVTVIENAPATIDGQPAFRLHVQYKTPKGLRIEQMIVGIADGKRVLRATYQAPTLHFFARDRNAFEEVVKSLRRGKPSTG
jgi:hypothetical protein